MENFSLNEIAQAVDGELIADSDLRTVQPTGGNIDTRNLAPGDLFFALEGERFDGHEFVSAAMEQGASGAVVNRKWYNALATDSRPSGPLILTEASDLALGDAARVYREKFQIPVIAITGSNGKTTTKDMTTAVLKTSYHVLSTIGNQNTRLGVPLTLFRLSEEHDVAIIEMGISEHGGLQYLCEIAQPTIGVITNIGPTHLEFLGSVEGVAKAKGELLEYLDESSMAILNLDDLLLSKERAKVKGRLLGFGIEEICQFRGERLITDQEGCGQFSLQGRNFQLPIAGRHNVYNALAAAAIGAVLEIPIAVAASALAKFQPTDLRSQLVEKDGIRLVNDAYNANPASMKAALEALLAIDLEGSGRRIAILGDMLELGPGAGCAHQDLGKFAANRGIDVLFALGELSREVCKGGIDGGLPSEKSLPFKERENLIEALDSFLKPNDLILLKGSRGLAMEKVASALGFNS